MIIPKTFYSGLPQDGAVSGGVGDVLGVRTTKVSVFDQGATCPGNQRWRISHIRVTNMTREEAFFSIALVNMNPPPTGPLGFYVQTDVGVTAPVSPFPIPMSTNVGSPTGTAPIGFYIAYSEPLGPNDRYDSEAGFEEWVNPNSGIWVGATPGAVSGVGFGGVSMAISGFAYRD